MTHRARSLLARCIPIYPCTAGLDLEIDRKIGLNAPGSMLK